MSKKIDVRKDDYEMIGKKLYEDLDNYLAGMDAYIEKLKRLSGPEGEKIARESLYRSGVLTKSGKPKKQIVNRV